MQDALWVFGYGSLVWRPAFAFAERRNAWIRGFSRRFWQGSTDHRGVPGAPGRVVTLLAEAEARCFGVAYRVPESDAEAVLSALDHRERGGYERHALDLHFDDGAATTGLVYIATEANPNYLGPASLEVIAAQVARACGPSGSNAEYVRELARALREMTAHDDHVFALDALVQRRTVDLHGLAAG
jgi:cation transport protein ChaC